LLLLLLLLCFLFLSSKIGGFEEREELLETAFNGLLWSMS